MSYPPQPPFGPPSGPPSGPPGYPPSGPPGYPPQGPPGFGPYGGGFGGPPKKSRTGLIIGLVALAMLLVVGVVVTAVLVLGGDDDDTSAGKDDSTASSTATTDGTPTPTDPSSTTTPATPYSPTEDETDEPAARIDVEASEFADDWDFKFGDVEHNAKYLESWKYDTCGPVEEGSRLTQQRCEYAVQWTYSALNGKARVTYVALVFDTEAHAKAADAALSDEDFDLRPEAQFPDFVQGKWNSGVVSNVVGVTVGTTNTKVDEKKLQGLVNYMTTDYKLALSFNQF
ncbi:hypothetical protein [Nocardioides sp. WS12]|uniref:hypothetical protein n=1 Tax=Nocardioides sp. WS12 TaxID=2486272 RepID=UPI0015FAB419|nr:hypothetical protein [Nocardioides sp. WS12]